MSNFTKLHVRSQGYLQEARACAHTDISYTQLYVRSETYINHLPKASRDQIHIGTAIPQLTDQLSYAWGNPTDLEADIKSCIYVTYTVYKVLKVIAPQEYS